MTRFSVHLAACLAVAIAFGVDGRAQQRTGVDQVAWLAGCWEASTPQGIVEEHWLAPRGGTMIGSGRTVRDSKFIGSDFVILREQDGRLAYEAHPDGRAGTVFVAERVE